ncbi:hypothetical protein GCM10025864_04390 [Luteimicrobium album]|uniref:YjeF N-terminal domain-containing protein n=1 Tax=Luteimicrobium album TaxID=1054550 RepID=A0ABQ6HYR2_9MICO|nr:hypothetical protein GCM10025864_04390 [Luteimicrobium album]
MIEAHTAAVVRAAEQPLLDAGVPLMERAAFALSRTVLRELESRRGRVVGARVVLLVGSGNNGGDALFAGAYLRRRGVAVTAYGTGSRVHDGGRDALLRAGGRFVDLSGDGASAEEGPRPGRRSTGRRPTRRRATRCSTRSSAPGRAAPCAGRERTSSGGWTTRSRALRGVRSSWPSTCRAASVSTTARSRDRPCAPTSP